MLNNIILSSLFVISFILVHVKCKVPIVSTSHGQISGKVMKTLINEQDYQAFIGIPYAIPPVKGLRFLPPKPIDAWDGTLSATKEKKACIQLNYNIKKRKPIGVFGSEDCLYLNIYTPNIDDEKRSIVVFLQNSAFNNANNKTNYGPDFLIEEDIIVVHLNHRLSIFGFLALEDDLVPGNAGLKDIVVALEWVKRNAKKFGGDPGKITLIGSEDGATAADFLVHSNKHYLFNSVILQSGSSLSSMFLQEDARQRAFNVVKALKKPCSSNKNLLETLNDITPEEMLPILLQSIPKDYFKENQRSILPFGPVVENNPLGLILDYPENFKENRDIPVLLGFNSLEGLEATLHYLMEPRYMSYLKKDTPVYIPVRVGFKFAPYDENYKEVMKNLIQFYFNGQITIKTISNAVTYLSDVLRTFSIDKLTRHYSKITSNNVFYYYFDFETDLNDNKRDIMNLAKVDEDYPGAATGDELCYLFSCPSLKDKYLNYNRLESPEIIMQRKLVRLWANFVKYGNPIQDDGDKLLEEVQWPAYNINTKQYLHIGNTLEVKHDLYKDRFVFWERIIEKYEELLVSNKKSHEEL